MKYNQVKQVYKLNLLQRSKLYNKIYRLIAKGAGPYGIDWITTKIRYPLLHDYLKVLLRAGV